jgi:hypothetical protein
MDDFEKGDRVILLDRPLGHATKIRGVIVGLVGESSFNVLLTNGYGKGKIRRLKSFELRKEDNCVFGQRDKNKGWETFENDN